MTLVYHYTSFATARIILNGSGLDPRFGQPCCHEFLPGRTVRGLRALLDPDPACWRESRVFGDYMALLMRLIEDRLCLEIQVADDEAMVVERAAIEGYMHGLAALRLSARLPAELRFFRRVSAEAAMWQSRTAPSNRARWSTFLLPKVIITAPIPAERIRVCAQQPYLVDARWSNADTRERADAFDVAPFPSIWRELRAQCAPASRA